MESQSRLKEELNLGTEPGFVGLIRHKRHTDGEKHTFNPTWMGDVVLAMNRGLLKYRVQNTLKA